MAEFLNPIAELRFPDSGSIIEPEQAHELKENSIFFCPDHSCKDPERKLSVVKSKDHNYFFRHQKGFSHDIHPQTLLHKSAVKWFEDKKEFEIPKFELEKSVYKCQRIELNIEKTELEYNILKTIIPDVKLCTNDGFEFAIEIVVTSDLSEEKIKLIEEFNLPTIRIGLSDFYNNNKERCRTDLSFVKTSLDMLLVDNNLKTWVVKPKNDNAIDKLESSKKTNYIPGIIVIVGTLIYGFCKFLKNRKVKKKTRR